MGILAAIKNTILDPIETIRIITGKDLAKLLPDKANLKYRYKRHFGEKLNLKQPKKFTEKIQWLKLYNRDPLNTILVDKYAVRGYISEKIGKEFLVPLLGRWERFEDIDFSSLPDKFVLKCNHDSGSVVVCKDKSKLDYQELSIWFKKHLKRNFYRGGRQWAYKNVKPCIICEEYKEDESGDQLRDYKVYCFNGIPKYIEVHYDRFTSQHNGNIYDTKWQRLQLRIGNARNDFDVTIKKPIRLNEIILITEKLSRGLPFLRVDYYISSEGLYVGELTLSPTSGFGKFNPPEYDRVFGELLQLPKKQRFS